MVIVIIIFLNILYKHKRTVYFLSVFIIMINLFDQALYTHAGNNLVSTNRSRDKLSLMHKNDAHFTPTSTTIRFPYGLRKRNILSNLKPAAISPVITHQHHFTLDLDDLDRLFEYRYIHSGNYSFSVTDI